MGTRSNDSGDRDTAIDSSPTSGYKWELVALCWLAFFLNQADRQVFNVLLPSLRSSLELNEAQLGMVATGFTLIYGLLVPLAGCLGDMFSRKWLVIGSLTTYSVGTLLTGTSGGLVGLLIYRSLMTGAGQSLYYPATNSLIGAHHQQTRARALGIHQTAQYLGIVASSWMAGAIAEMHGWRTPFYVFGAAGLVLAVVMSVRLRPDRGGGENHGRLMLEAVRTLARKPTMYLVTIAFGGMGFVTVGFLTWTPTYLYDRYQLSLSEAAFHAMSIHYSGAAVSVALTGYLSDRWAQCRPRVRLELAALGLTCASPFLYWLGSGGSLAGVYVALGCFGIFRGMSDANWVASVFDVVPARYRSSALGLMLAFAYVVGSLAPLILGAMKPRIGLGAGLSSLAVIYVVSSALLWVASRWTFERDRDRGAIAATGVT